VKVVEREPPLEKDLLLRMKPTHWPLPAKEIERERERERDSLVEGYKKIH
jgi:hypothetical protein